MPHASPYSKGRAKPLLAPISSPKAEERESRIDGRIYVRYQDTDNSLSGRRYKRFRSGLDYRHTNPFGAGGMLRFKADTNNRQVESDGSDSEDSRTRIQRFSYVQGLAKDDPRRLEVGRFLPHLFPQFGLLDGAEYVMRSSGGTQYGVNAGFLPNYDLELGETEDVSMALFGRWVSDPQEILAFKLGLQKTWHEGNADRDLIATGLNWKIDPRFTFRVSALGDYFDGNGAFESEGLKLTQAHSSLDWRFANTSGASVYVSYLDWPELLKDDLPDLLPSSIQDQKVVRGGISTSLQVTKRTRLFARYDSWSDNLNSGTFADARIDVRELLYKNSISSLGLFDTQGSFSTGLGARLRHTHTMQNSQATLSYETTQYEQAGFQGVQSELQQQVLGANLSSRLWTDFDVFAEAQQRFGDQQDSFTMSMRLTWRFCVVGRNTMSNLNTQAHFRGVVVTLMLGLLAVACVVATQEGSDESYGWSANNGGVVPHDSFPADCILCHVEGSWSQLRADFTFDHEPETGVRLEGAHQSAQCLRCHNDRGSVATFSAQGCAGCHEDLHEGELGTQCASCHDQNSWVLGDELALHNRTRFPLVGSHAALQCWTCHTDGDLGNWKSVDVNCATCHLDQVAAIASPNHVSNGWVSACDRCHIPTTWDGAGFNHFSFILDRAHRRTDCAQCHLGGVFAGVPRNCFGCHEADYIGADDPDHEAGSFSTSCEQCHNTSDWQDAFFSHAGITTGCVTCHQADYDGTDDPDHGAKSFSTDCENCHNTNNWDDADFSHAGILTGCVTCHQDDYDDTDDPNHAAKSFSTDCEDCHNTDDWDDADFNHLGIVDNCAQCHLTDYNAMNDPDHSAFSFPLSCEQCHVTRTWIGASFDHPGIVNNCVTCHLPEYNGTSDPDHAAFSIPQTCEQSHVTRTWIGASFDHTGVLTNCSACHIDEYNTTTDPNHQLAGVSCSCELCHGTRNWDSVNMNHVGIGSQCVACHQSDYNATTSPNHTNAGFPTTCAACHTTNIWVPATFDHQFPITSGDHSDIDCNECHTIPGNYRSFSCIDCHTHNFTDMQDKHDEDDIRGYVWETAACYACHPTGQDR